MSGTWLQSDNTLQFYMLDGLLTRQAGNVSTAVTPLTGCIYGLLNRSLNKQSCVFHAFRDVCWFKDKLMRFWWAEVKGQGHCFDPKHVFGHNSKVHTYSNECVSVSVAALTSFMWMWFIPVVLWCVVNFLFSCCLPGFIFTVRFDKTKHPYNSH